MEEALGVKKIIMVEKQEDKFDLWSLFIKNNYLKVFIWRNFLLHFWSRLDYISKDILWAQLRWEMGIQIGAKRSP